MGAQRSKMQRLFSFKQVTDRYESVHAREAIFLYFFYMDAIDSLPPFYMVRRYNDSGKGAVVVMRDYLVIAAPTKTGETL